MRAEPFIVAIASADLDDLRCRLEATRWADDFGNEDWSYGVGAAGRGRSETSKT